MKTEFRFFFTKNTGQTHNQLIYQLIGLGSELFCFTILGSIFITLNGIYPVYVFI